LELVKLERKAVYSGLIWLHVHHHAAEGPVFGQGIELGVLPELLAAAVGVWRLSS
jgi:hypothetical protein